MTGAETFLDKLFALGNSYWLTRFVILRLLGFVYAVAFLVAAQQLVPLIGAHGLTPATHFLNTIQTQLVSRTDGMMQVPMLFWFGISDNALSISSWIGVALSLVVLAGYANAVLLTVLWTMYMSIVHIGQIWYGYGWEIQLLETGFLSIFLCPLLDGRPFPKCSPPILVIWLFRWLGFRIMVGAQTFANPVLVFIGVPLFSCFLHFQFQFDLIFTHLPATRTRPPIASRRDSSRLFEPFRLLVCCNHFAHCIVTRIHGIM
jgi:lipase maturation factor